MILFFTLARTAQTFGLARAGFEVAVAAGAHQNRSNARLLYPVAVLLKSLGRALGLDIFARVFCHT